MADYLRSEFLDRVSRADVAFLTRTSILERMSGPLCDVTVGAPALGARARPARARNLLVIPLDRRGEWYRYHHLFRELLHAELVRREPEMLARAPHPGRRVVRGERQPEAAIEHAAAAGDAERVARLVLQLANPVWASGRLDTVLRWMEWFAADGRIERHPAVAVHGALIYALDRARRATPNDGRPPPSAPPSRARCRTGTRWRARSPTCGRCCAATASDEMRQDARTALGGLRPTSPYRATMLHAEGVGRPARRRPGRADLFFSRAVDEASSAGVVPFVPLVLAERGIVAIERDDWSEATALADAGAGHHAGGQLRRLLDERARLRLGGAGRVPAG